MPHKERFEKFINRVPGGCWLWTAATDTYGYGQFNGGAPACVMTGAHRASWAFYNGPMVKKGREKMGQPSKFGIRSRMQRWLARAPESYGRKLLYLGRDFFEACCARKSWEAKHAA